MKCVLAGIFFAAGVMTSSMSVSADNRTTALDRVRSDVEFFAADDQEGRGVETRGIDRAADRIIAEFERIGLRPVMPDGSWRQGFDVAISAVAVGKRTKAEFRHSDGTELSPAAGQGFQPLLRGSAGSASGGIVFLGYGVAAPENQYDEYRNVSVAGRTVIILRKVPRKGDPEGPFHIANDTSRHEFITTKVHLAIQHQAAAVILVNDYLSAPNAARDQLTSPDGFGEHGSNIPIIHVRRSTINKLLEHSPLVTRDGRELRSLRAATKEIDSTLVPLSQELRGWTADVTTDFDRNGINAWNILGMVEGQGALAHETIVVGGHYDHIGYGAYGSRAGRKRRGEIHNGADDNASGTAAVLELARRVVSGPAPSRRIVFACFSGEERGLLGSKHYVDNSPVPIRDTVAMLNFDMIGSLRSNRLEVNGVGTAAEFLPIVTHADDESPLNVNVVSTPYNGGSDHLPFYRKQIPVMFCFTGETDRYHTPDDDADAINMEGLVSVIDVGEDLLTGIDQLGQRPGYRRVMRGRLQIGVLGIRPDLSGESEGVRVLSVLEGSAAQKASVQVGDVIVNIDATHVDGYASLYDFLRNTREGQAVRMTVVRGNDRLRLPVTLGSVSR